MDISSLLFVSALTLASPGSTGDHEILRAYSKQSGLEAELHRIERTKISPELRRHVGNAALISKTLIDRRIKFQWTFP